MTCARSVLILFCPVQPPSYSHSCHQPMFTLCVQHQMSAVFDTLLFMRPQPSQLSNSSSQQGGNHPALMHLNKNLSACLQITCIRHPLMRPQWSQHPAGSSLSSQPAMPQLTSQPSPSSVSLMPSSAAWGTTTSPTCQRWVDKRLLLSSLTAKLARGVSCSSAQQPLALYRKPLQPHM